MPVGAGLPEDIETVLTRLEAGKQLYLRFLTGDGDRTSLAKEAIDELQTICQRLRELRGQYTRHADLLEKRLEEALSYLAFLIHHGG
jgi:hypothetical protein